MLEVNLRNSLLLGALMVMNSKSVTILNIRRELFDKHHFPVSSYGI
jgi:hypothetical protein